MTRIEARSKNSDIHLGHIFTDGPSNKGNIQYEKVVIAGGCFLGDGRVIF